MAFKFAENTIEIENEKFKFRELTVAENDFCADASRDKEGNIDPRKMMRLMVSKSAIDPKLTIDDLAEIPNRIYLRFCEVVNDLNMPEIGEEDDSGND